MVTILERLKLDRTAAMRSHDKQRLSVIRMLLTEIEVGATATKKIDAEQSVVSYKKKLEKALEETPEGDAKEALRAEIEIVSQYAPRVPTEDELLTYIKGMDLTQPIGPLMKAVKIDFPYSDGRLVSEIFGRVRQS